MRTTVTLDDDVYEAAVANSRATGKRLGKVLSEMARHALRAPRHVRRRSSKASRFRGFDVPRGAKPILASRVQAALDEDGIV
jgi:hypothetical protein